MDDFEERRKNTERMIKESYDPQNVGRMSDPDGFGEITGSCGDTMEFYMRMKDGQINEILFYTDGCETTIACGSVATQLAQGKGLEETLAITNEDIMDELGGLPEDHLHCAQLTTDTLRKAVTNYLARI